MGWFKLAAMFFGATIKGATTGIGLEKKKNELRQAIEREERIKQENLDLMDANFELKQKEANKNADRADQQSDFNENLVSEDTNNQIDALQLKQAQELADFNNMFVQIGAQEGNELASMSTNGTRTGGSLAQAVDMQKASSTSQLQLTEDSTRQSDKIQLANILNGLAQNVNGIQNDRTGAYDLREAFKEGGDQWNIYKMERDKMENAYNDNINDMKSSIKDIDQNRFSYIMQGIFGGATQGLSTGQSLGTLAKDLGLDTSFKSQTSVTAGANSAVTLGASLLNKDRTFGGYGIGATTGARLSFNNIG